MPAALEWWLSSAALIVFALAAIVWILERPRGR
jgi:hypothetical protein